jgi:hypothetical protein
MHSNAEYTAVLVLAWPEVTARTDDKIMKILRDLGVVKNLNILVGHAAMMILEGSALRYYDFGRYITPRALGRVRSARTDPALTFNTVPKWSMEGRILNIEQICEELSSKSAYTHGEGCLQMGIYYSPDIKEVEAYAIALQHRGLIDYDTFDKRGSNCARFIQTAILHGLNHLPKHSRRFRIPVTYGYPTPYFNVLATSIENTTFFEWKNGTGVWKKTPLVHAWWDLTTKVFGSMSRSATTNFPCDRVPGKLDKPEVRPPTVPGEAIYLGGLGESAWYHHLLNRDGRILGLRWTYNGDLDFQSYFSPDETLSQLLEQSKATIGYDSHFAWLTFEHNGQKFRAYNVNK